MAIPPKGIFYNRMSASSHTRGHRYSLEIANPMLSWLQAHGRTVVNGAETINFELNKIRQYAVLRSYGLQVPATFVANSLPQAIEFAKRFSPKPFIVKPNRGGKGLGVQLFNTVEAFETQVAKNPEGFETLDGLTIVQEYIKPQTSDIVRMEFIGGKFYYAVVVDTSDGFELCPADACQLGDLNCPTRKKSKKNSGNEENTSSSTEDGVSEGKKKPKFKLLDDKRTAELKEGIVPIIERMLKEHKLDIVGIEFVENENGEPFIYDLNTNTNYNPEAEAAAGGERRGMSQIASYLDKTLSLSLTPES